MWTVPAGDEAPARQAVGAKRRVPITNVDSKCLGALRVPKSKNTPVIKVAV